MIFAAIQVSLAGVKLLTFFINRRLSEENKDNVGDAPASGGISILGVISLIAGSLILAVYCEDEPTEKTFNIFKAGVYMNLFLFAITLVFICGFLIAFILDICTRRRGRAITFRMFLSGTLILSITAAFFGATGFLGLKYVQDECSLEVELYFRSNSTDIYLDQSMQFAAETLEGSYTKPTKESLYWNYQDRMIGEPYIFVVDDTEISHEPFYVSSVVFNTTDSRKNIMNMLVQIARYREVSTGKIDLVVESTDTTCLETGLTLVGGLLACKIRFSTFQNETARYEESTNEIIEINSCAYEESEIYCNKKSASFPLCCEQFESKYTDGQDGDCWCINRFDDASCGFDKNLPPSQCQYRANTLDLEISDQKNYYCDVLGQSRNGYCKKENGALVWDASCKDEKDLDAKYNCCKNLESSYSFTRTWRKYNENQETDMTPSTCKQFNNCKTADQFFGGCCDSSSGGHSDCKYCKDVDETSSSNHKRDCGYSHCLTNDKTVEEKKSCCLEVERVFGFKFRKDSECGIAINYDPCVDETDSLACKGITDYCKSTDFCFPDCCTGLKFDFANKDTISDSMNSDCFQLAPERIESANDVKEFLGHYIYHHTGKFYGRESCSAVKGIIDPSCCNSGFSYHVEDPCYCHGRNPLSSRCARVDPANCLPGNSAYPQCCFEIGAFFAPDHFCTCRQNQDRLSLHTCSDVQTSEPFDFIEKCPNPCAGSTFQSGFSSPDPESWVLENPSGPVLEDIEEDTGMEVSESSVQGSFKITALKNLLTLRRSLEAPSVRSFPISTRPE
ncbi:Oidioi.mRNA.OKI2018_I69.chr1.g253.t1.cds [Oikopleura dioica]|uniref:Oidioi.mRNA.OKI2018_I69.chr1.g253.t1.cds n=1 Tax=Oikopleura dioica TaxID=34765 RepID=A0ABN7SN01_OIKDI|nr:Oidioi.mRNA.OKI2018_I69.chr1.g253.t1.cds [Oikopleura dioica]